LIASAPFPQQKIHLSTARRVPAEMRVLTFTKGFSVDEVLRRALPTYNENWTIAFLTS
jgi:hypothetical protein